MMKQSALGIPQCNYEQAILALRYASSVIPSRDLKTRIKGGERWRIWKNLARSSRLCWYWICFRPWDEARSGKGEVDQMIEMKMEEDRWR